MTAKIAKIENSAIFGNSGNLGNQKAIATLGKLELWESWPKQRT
jgi:hypothetical protein